MSRIDLKKSSHWPNDNLGSFSEYFLSYFEYIRDRQEFKPSPLGYLLRFSFWSLDGGHGLEKINFYI